VSNYLAFSVLILSLLMPAAAFAQYTPGMILGMVHDESGAAVPGVKIELSQGENTAQAISNSGGSFSFYYAYPGDAEINFKFDSVNSGGVYKAVIYPGQILRLNVALNRRQIAFEEKNPWEIQESSGAPSTWRTERVITEEWTDSLPNGPNLWNFLNRTESSVVADRLDTSGMHSNRELLLGVRGSSYTQNQSTINDIEFASPSGDGMLAFPDISTMKTIVYTVGDSPAEHMGTGAHLSLIPKTGNSKIHGQSHLYFQGGVLQNVNPNDKLRLFGITDSDERWRHFINANFQIGGPLGRSRWLYYGSVSLQDLVKNIREHVLPVSGTVVQESFNLSGNLTGRDRLTLYWAGQQLDEPQANASPQVTRDASLDQNRQYQSILAAWTRTLSPKSLIDTRFGVVLSNVHSRPQSNVVRQNREELFPGFALYDKETDSPLYLEMVDRLNNTISGAPPLIINSDAIALEAKVGYSTIREGFRKSNHRISTGVSMRRTAVTQRQTAIDNVNLLFFEGAPESVRLLNTPSRMRDRINHLELYAADATSFSRLSMSIGAYGSFSNGANILNSGVLANQLTWKNLSGRVGLAYSIWKKKKLIARAGLARTYNQPLTRIWTAVNPDGLGFERYLWKDTNGDLQFQPGENTDVLKVYGAPYTLLDPGLKNSHMNEINLGLSVEILHGIAFHAFGFRRTEKDLLSLVNVGVPFSSYTPIQVSDPGPDGYLNTDDDQLATAYNQNRETLGKDRYLLTNPKGHSGESEGLDFKLGLTFRKLRAELSLMHYRSVAATAPGMLVTENDTSALLGIYDDPNKAILAHGSTYFDRGTVGQLWATYDLHWGIKLSMIANYMDGLPYSRYLPVTGLNQGVFGILMRQRGQREYGVTGGYRTAHYRNVDTRIMREFALGPGRLSAIMDVFNLENRSGNILQTEVTAPTHYWRLPLRFQTPRSIQLGLNYHW
jgi:hypothetical protein